MINEKNHKSAFTTPLVKNILYLALLSTSLFLGCNGSSKKAEEISKPETYTSQEVGWTITIPKGYQTISKNRMDANQKRWEEKMGADSTKQDTGAIKKLVNFQKNQFNSLFATAAKYDQAKKDNYLSTNRELRKMIYDTYVNQKIKVDSLSGTEMVAGKQFETFTIKMFGPNGDLILNQLIYNQLVNGYEFNVSINYNNDVDKTTLVNSFKQSKFTQ